MIIIESPFFCTKNKRKVRIDPETGKKAPNKQPYRYRYWESSIDTDFDSIEKNIGKLWTQIFRSSQNIGSDFVSGRSPTLVLTEQRYVTVFSVSVFSYFSFGD